MAVVFLVLGMLLRIWGVFSLRDLNYQKIKAPQKLITTGLYSVVRNPMYLGTLLLFGGLCGICYKAFVPSIPVMLLTFNFILERIYKEEDILLRQFGEDYWNYANKTKRLIPFVW